VLLDDVNCLEGSLLCLFNVLLVIRDVADERAAPGAELGKDLGVDIGQPFQDRSVVLLGLAEQGGLFVLGSDFVGC